MPAVTVRDITILPRVIADPNFSVRPIKSVTTAPQGYEGEGFPVRRAFAGVDVAALDPFIHLDQMGEVLVSTGQCNNRINTAAPKAPGPWVAVCVQSGCHH